jgi:hypothetical protein
MLVRKQIIVPSETDKRIRRLAARRDSQSALIVERSKPYRTRVSQVDHVPPSPAQSKAPRKLSEEVDEVVTADACRLSSSTPDRSLTALG